MTAPIISSTSPTLPNLILSLIHLIFSGSSKVGAVKGVDINVGQIVLTLMPKGPNSIAIDFVKPSTACFEAL